MSNIGKEAWYKDDKGKIHKGYVLAESDTHPYTVLLKVPRLHNKLVQILWGEAMFGSPQIKIGEK